MSSQTPGGSFIRTDVPATKRPKLPFDQERSLLKVIVVELIIWKVVVLLKVWFSCSSKNNISHIILHSTTEILEIRSMLAPLINF